MHFRESGHEDKLAPKPPSGRSSVTTCEPFKGVTRYWRSPKKSKFNGCRETSKTKFTRGWTCLNKRCDKFFEFGNSDVKFNDLRYNDNFLREIIAYQGIDPTQADQKKAKFHDPRGDHLALLNVYDVRDTHLQPTRWDAVKRSITRTSSKREPRIEPSVSLQSSPLYLQSFPVYLQSSSLYLNKTRIARGRMSPPSQSRPQPQRPPRPKENCELPPRIRWGFRQAR
ncbi:hypothetical protein F4821DRAFT_189216 [Hypoxylon rubiginosum]|uniref:Uncharacterized protein n=1 Tax=Hypoxylon rubiginosum TaxID=110542 RepID=A0ACC0DFU4_9PEZI|nr:hypothetical protein F4821DRAFT_189216 [Hypoxylon rubiginosum]